MNEHPYCFPFLRDARDVLSRHRAKAATFFLATMALVLAGLALMPKQYLSEAKLFVRVGRESVTLDPTATTGQTISVYESRENEINSVLDVIQSRVILEGVVDALGAEVILDGRRGSTDASERRREQAIRQLEQSIKVTHGRNSSVITVSGKARSPELAQKIVQAVVETFHQQHLRVNRTAGSHQFFASQSELLKEQLFQARQELRDAKNAIGMTSIEGQRKILEERISAIETAALAARTDLAASEASTTALRETLDRLPERLVTQEITGFPNDAADQTRQQLYALQIREQDLLSKYTEFHPLVAAVRQQKEEAGQILASQGLPSTQSTSSVHPARQQLELDLLIEESKVASLRAQVASLEEQAARMQDRLRSLNDQEGRILELEQHTELLQLSHRAYSEKLEQARIDQALEEQHISNVNVVQPATYVSRPVGPKKALILVLGLLVAALGGVGFAFASESFHHSFQTRMEIRATRSHAMVH